MKKLLLVLFAMQAFPPLCGAGQGVFFSMLEDGSTMARSASGVALWRTDPAASGLPAAAPTQPRATPLSSTMPTWDPATTLDVTSDSSVAGPIFDSLGNAWILLNQGTNLVAYRSNGTSGTWQPPHVIAPALPYGAGVVGVAVDRTGGFYLTYGTSTDINSTSNPLMLAKYTTAAGWQAPVQIYNSPMPFGQTYLSVDSTGRLVVVFGVYQTGSYAISSIASNASQAAWGEVQVIEPSANSPVLPSVAANKSGTRLALVYLVTSPARHGMRYTFFNSTSGKWNSALPVPDTRNATFSLYLSLSSYPIAVDESGNVSFIVALSSVTRVPGSGLKSTWAVGGFHYEGGQWAMQELVPPSRSLPTLDNFSGTAINASGTVLITTPLYAGNNSVNVNVFRYTPGQGWNTEVAANYNSPTANRCNVAWFVGTEGVAVYTDHADVDHGTPLLSALYSNGTWGAGPLPPGNPTNIGFPGIATAPTGEALLAIPDEPAVLVTFLRP